MKKSKLWLISGGLAAFALSQGLFLVDQRKQAIVLQFGQFVRAVTDPGLHMKVPFIQDTLFYESRVMEYGSPQVSVTMEDQKRLVVDTYTRYKIADALKFYRAIKPATQKEIEQRLEVIVSSAVRNVLGRVPLAKTLTAERSGIMHDIVKEITEYSAQMGLEIVDVRIIRTELPVENREAVFSRMNAELDRIAKENLGKGQEAAQQIRAKTDKEKTIILANARRDAMIRRGEGEAESLQMRLEAFGKAPGFYEQYRHYTLNEEVFADGTKFILSADGPLGKVLTNILQKN